VFATTAQHVYSGSGLMPAVLFSASGAHMQTQGPAQLPWFNLVCLLVQLL
jgi:hypothetical protein